MISEYNYIIVDDDAFARETLVDLLSEYSRLKMLKSISESKMAIKHLAVMQPDLIFLDINMPDKSGMEVQQEILDLQLDAKVIFTTSHEEYVLEAFKNQAFDYLIKPVSKDELRETLTRFFADKEKKQMIAETPKEAPGDDLKNEIIIKNAYGTLLLQADEVLYIEAEGTYTKLYLTNGKTELVTKNIGKLENLFSSAVFFKISRSCIINLEYLKRTDRLNKKVVLAHKDREIVLKASRDRFYDLESRI